MRGRGGDAVDRARFLAVSREILESEGTNALTMRRVAEAVGRTQPAVYARFADKDELLAAIAIDGFEALAQRLERAAKRPDPIAAVASAYVAFAGEHPRLYELMFTDPIAVAFAKGEQTPPALRRSFAALLGAVRTRRDGRVLDPTRLELVTETLWAALHGIAVLAEHGRLRPGATLQRERVRAIVDALSAIPPSR